MIRRLAAPLFIRGEAFIKVDVPKGTTLRAVLPLSQAKPCYLSGYSKPVRT